MLEQNHFISGLSASSKAAYIKLLEQLAPPLEAILMIELSVGNKIYEVRANIEANDLIILLQHHYHQAYESNQLTKLVETDAHDHGVYYITKEKPVQTIIAPYL
jgi:hypothetical protein